MKHNRSRREISITLPLVWVRDTYTDLLIVVRICRLNVRQRDVISVLKEEATA